MNGIRFEHAPISLRKMVMVSAFALASASLAACSEQVPGVAQAPPPPNNDTQVFAAPVDFEAQAAVEAGNFGIFVQDPTFTLTAPATNFVVDGTRDGAATMATFVPNDIGTAADFTRFTTNVASSTTRLGTVTEVTIPGSAGICTVIAPIASADPLNEAIGTSDQCP
ncbi:MAG: hypothetical protein AAFY57_00505 [Cyanobacteria bacterium J06642_2]